MKHNKVAFTSTQVNTLSKLLKLAEECGEAVQMCSKYIENGAHNYSPDDSLKQTNKTLLSKEVGDILAVIDHLEEAGILDTFTVEQQRGIKYWKLHNKWN
jgi:NTP pyrophosphatase (non-canonical NTP hydrolase)